MARNIARFSPVTDLIRSGGMTNIDDIFREFALAPFSRALEQVPRMKVDIEEAEDSYLLRADVPGAKREDIAVSIDGNTVSITVNVMEQRSEERRNMMRTERIYGEEFRTFTLPQEIDEGKASATIDNGVLALTLPKKTGTGGRRLDIRDASSSINMQGGTQSISGKEQPSDTQSGGQGGTQAGNQPGAQPGTKA